MCAVRGQVVLSVILMLAGSALAQTPPPPQGTDNGAYANSRARGGYAKAVEGSSTRGGENP